MVKTFVVEERPPLKKALPFAGTHGLAKDPSTTEWIWVPGNWNTTVLPTAAVVLLGLKVSPLFPPTTTVWAAGLEAAVFDAVLGLVLVAGGGVDDELPPPPPAGGPY